MNSGEENQVTWKEYHKVKYCQYTSFHFVPYLLGLYPFSRNKFQGLFQGSDWLFQDSNWIFQDSKFTLNTFMLTEDFKINSPYSLYTYLNM